MNPKSTKTERKAPTEARYDTIKELALSIVELNQRAVVDYGPVAESIIATQSRDVKHIEQTLDGMLDFCGSDDMLAIFKKLCRYYYDINPAAVAAYIQSYREMWDEEYTAS